MITGQVDHAGVPIIMVPIGADSRRAIIDTGFNGDLELPLAVKLLVNIGTHLLHQHRLKIDFSARSVFLEKVA